ncbi:hypothetical protein [Burkholderia ubonensis]|uniref:Uncharacterized protein n=1 Tax=Burkholderia ubonensis TaxID=101571 RepID=A0A1R1J8X0_9BURK|nr:hypothetical protein [Burkholderia ubonensis]OMG71754.1 hypothetical protein BW685_18910 [Burkholderia ubonensis]
MAGVPASSVLDCARRHEPLKQQLRPFGRLLSPAFCFAVGLQFQFLGVDELDIRMYMVSPIGRISLHELLPASGSQMSGLAMKRHVAAIVVKYCEV